MIENRLVAFIKPVLLWSMLVIALLAVAAGFAHAEPTGPAPPAALADSTATWLIGALVALKAMEMILDWVAPRTKTTLDDSARDAIHRVRATAEEILAHVKPPQSGRVAMWPLIILAGSAIGIASQAMWFGGCSAAERGAGAAKIAALDCAKPQFATAAALVARWGVEAAIAGHIDWAKIETDAEGFGIGVGSCGYAEFLRAWKSRPVPQTATLGAAPDDAQAGLERLRAKLGGAKIKLADGTIL